MLQVIKQGFQSQGLPQNLIDALLDAYIGLKNRYFLGDFRPNEVEGGLFSEAAFRLLEFRCFNKYTRIGKLVDTKTLIPNLENIPSSDQPEAIRIHIPRTLRVIYDIRSKRHAAHLADGIDPNTQDATLVVACCDWVMAELVRLYHSVTPAEAQKIVEDLVEKKSPVIQNFNGFLKTLNPKWGPKERALVTLYQRGAQGATIAELTSWLKPDQRANASRTIRQMEYDKDWVHQSQGRIYITAAGNRYVESNGLLQPV